MKDNGTARTLSTSDICFKFGGMTLNITKQITIEKGHVRNFKTLLYAKWAWIVFSCVCPFLTFRRPIHENDPFIIDITNSHLPLKKHHPFRENAYEREGTYALVGSGGGWALFIARFGLTHISLDKMAAISQTTFSNASLWMKTFVFWFEFNEIST